jgi:EAL domain-containing protein (putative c-di-GMP-specific phosphodiesterase class I)
MGAPPVPPRDPGSAGETRAIRERRPWRCIVLLEIANFALLRRHVGMPAAERVAHDIVGSLTALKPECRARVIGRDLIEIRIEGLGRGDLEELVTDCETLFANTSSLDGASLLVDVVVGAAADRGSNCDDVRLVEEAELALIDARRERRPVIRDTTAAPIPLDGIALSRDLPGAITRDELFLQYQPKLHVRQQRVASIEALIRWRHPRRGLVMPNDFIPLAEQSRVIAGMTLWTIRRVIADQQSLAAAGHDLMVFINISGVLLGDSAFVRQACNLIQQSGVRIGFEITETAVIRDPLSAIANLNVFSEIGVTIAIDDYGAGLSSLAYLKQLPAKELKIDKMFVTQLTSSNRDPLIVRSTIDLAHALEMEVVAEGVETPAALALLSVMGCDMVQGFLISRPIGLDGLVAFLGNQDNQIIAKPEPMLMRFSAEQRGQ